MMVVKGGTPCKTSSCGAAARRLPAVRGAGRAQGRGGGTRTAETPRRERERKAPTEKYWRLMTKRLWWIKRLRLRVKPRRLDPGSLY